MGRKDKHKSGGSRNNPVFKVVGTRVKKGGKGKPKSVDINVKKFHNKDKTKSKIDDLDAQLYSIQHTSVKIGGQAVTAKKPTKIEPVKVSCDDVNMDELTESMKQTIAKCTDVKEI